jgi:hypothetical protein
MKLTDKMVKEKGDSKYIVFYDETDNGTILEQYNIIEGDEYHSPILFVDGKENNHFCTDPHCDNPGCQWEPDTDYYEFQNNLPVLSLI